MQLSSIIFVCLHLSRSHALAVPFYEWIRQGMHY